MQKGSTNHNVLTTFENLIPAETCNVLVDCIFRQMHTRKEFSNSNSQPLISDTPYHYWLLNPAYPRAIFADVLESINFAFLQLGIEPLLSTNKCHPPYVTTKLFSQESHYGWHAEPKSLFGDWSYVLFLSDETLSPLIFPTREFVQGDFNLTQSCSSDIQVSEEEEPYLFVDRNNIQVKPSIGTLIVFRARYIHGVQACFEKTPPYFRPHLSGWPQAEDLRKKFRAK